MHINFMQGSGVIVLTLFKSAIQICYFKKSENRSHGQVTKNLHFPCMIVSKTSSAVFPVVRPRYPQKPDFNQLSTLDET